MNSCIVVHRSASECDNYTALAQSSGGVAICYVFPVLWMMSRLRMVVRNMQHKKDILKVTRLELAHTHSPI